MSGNTTLTGAIENNTFRSMTFGVSGDAMIAGANTELFTLTDEITGEFTYIGVPPYSGVITAFVTATSTGGAVEFRFLYEQDSGSVVKVWLSSGTVGEEYEITCRIVTNSGRTDDRTFIIEVQSR